MQDTIKDGLTQQWNRLGLVGKVINLKGRDDRKRHAQTAADKIGLPIEFFEAEKHPLGGVAGCFDSHQRVCMEALKAGQKRVLVLEDDFEGTDELKTEYGLRALTEAVDFILSDNNWKIVYLGVLPNIWMEKSVRISNHVYKLKPWACTHAMIVNENYMKEIVSWKYVHGKDAYDWRHRKCQQAYAFHPQAMKQYESPSDIRVQFPTPPFLQDWTLNASSWYALNVGTSLVYTLCLFAVLVASMSIGISSKAENARFAKQTLERGILKH